MFTASNKCRVSCAFLSVVICWTATLKTSIFRLTATRDKSNAPFRSIASKSSETLKIPPTENLKLNLQNSKSELYWDMQSTTVLKLDTIPCKTCLVAANDKITGKKTFSSILQSSPPSPKLVCRTQYQFFHRTTSFYRIQRQWSSRMHQTAFWGPSLLPTEQVFQISPLPGFLRNHQWIEKGITSFPVSLRNKTENQHTLTRCLKKINFWKIGFVVLIHCYLWSQQGTKGWDQDSPFFYPQPDNFDVGRKAPKNISLTQK